MNSINWHGGTYKASDNFPAQKNRCQDGITPYSIPPFRWVGRQLNRRPQVLDPTALPRYGNCDRIPKQTQQLGIQQPTYMVQ
ncbi:TPA: hypothetical protein EYO57_17425 [Candidatus Poribacteria bacterium]|nr:hypothetical protein [Candidatus Poribacteria bacterium]HIN29414.1 hypothetical protein [Candidatus Poribacteria bacterium]